MLKLSSSLPRCAGQLGHVPAARFSFVCAARSAPMTRACSVSSPIHNQTRHYQHHSAHAPSELNTAARLSYSRQDLVSAWHRASRDVSPGDLSWRGRDVIDAKFAVIKEDGTLERDPEKRLVKEDLIKTFGLNPRDLRTLDSHILDVRPSLLVCKKGIIVTVPIARAIIAHDRIILIGRDENNPLCSEQEAHQLAEALQNVMKYLTFTGSTSTGNGQLPFELKALEAILLLTVRGFGQVVSEIEERVYAKIPELRFGVSPIELRDLLEAKRTVDDCVYSGRALQSAIAAVLSEDEDLAAMYLTDKFDGKPHDTDNHQSAELLLEASERRLDQVNESSERLSRLLSDVDGNISLVLASTRVKLQNLELQTAITTLALGAGTALAGFFGMNLKSGAEEDPNMFMYMTTAGCGIMSGIMVIGWVRLIRARRSQLMLRGTNQQSTPRPSRMMSEVHHATAHDGIAKEVSPKAPSLQPSGEKPGPGTKKDGTEL